MRPGKKNVETVVLGIIPQCFATPEGELVIDPREWGLKDALTTLEGRGVRTVLDDGESFAFGSWARRLRIMIDCGHGVLPDQFLSRALRTEIA